MPPTISPSRARLAIAAAYPSAVKPSSIGSSRLPTLPIWKKWSITQIESKPTSSAVRTTDASVSAMPVSPPGQVNELICRPSFMGGRSLGEKVGLGRHHDVADDRPVARWERHAAHQDEGPPTRLAAGQLGCRGDLVGDRDDRRV